MVIILICNNCSGYYYISITIVQNGKYHRFVAVCIVRVHSTSSNANGNKQVIFSGIAVMIL